MNKERAALQELVDVRNEFHELLRSAALASEEESNRILARHNKAWANTLQVLAEPDLMSDWIRQGEVLMKSNRVGTMFRLGAWWADRPWRERNPHV